MKIGDVIVGLVFGFVGGLIATLMLIHIGEGTSEPIFGASVPMTRFYLTVIISVACLVCEMAIGTSAREVGFDICTAVVLAIWFVEDSSFLDITNKIQTIQNVMNPVMIAVAISTVLSNPKKKLGEKVAAFTPFGKKSE